MKLEAAPEAAEPPKLKPPVWRLIVDGECSPAWNMALDGAIADAVAGGLVPPTIRLYRWDRPTLSLGRYQSSSRDIDAESCAALGVTMVRRPTGGRGILHGGDQTLSLSVPVRLLGDAGKSVVASYRVLSGGLRLGLARFGVVLHDGGCARPAAISADCFAINSRADLVTECGGLKLVGAAQRRREGVILQQASIRHTECAVRGEQVFRGTCAPEVYPLAQIADEDMESALVDGFAEAFGVRLHRDSPCNWELERCSVLLPSAAVR